MGEPINLPVGYKFCPPEDVSVMYLKMKILNEELPADVIPTVDIYSCPDPSQIPFSEFTHGPENEWYFFTNRREENRIQTTNGWWEEIEDGEVYNDDDEIIGFTKILEFSCPDDTEKEQKWYIHEYRANPASFTAAELADDSVKEKISNFVLCKVVCEEEIPPSKPPSSSSDDEDDDEVVDAASP
ncbi:hypothetical protein Vadar_013337 [Vaccinium darrowii]|uniref:Uncharacterized protein n=1 Tax=Vaccinium darrowii TaxID=229202 RepID=A0ACB7YVF5_9ERIC|nr:hypothetical protein Vadar_013337 [Vaccinium darrowii]